MASKQSTPYPTSWQIEDIFALRSSEEGTKEFETYVSPNVEVIIAGHDHHLAGTHTSHDAHKEHTVQRITELLDPSKPKKLEVVRVIGGGDSPWACVQMTADAKTKAGKKWHHEYVYVVRFNDKGKIVKMIQYYDTAHVQGHLDQHKENGNGNGV